MTLTDTGPMVAIIHQRDPAHDKCISTVKTLPPGPFVSTWACFTEAMHFLYRIGGQPAQATLWTWIEKDRLVLYDLNRNAQLRMVELMVKYVARPMDLADATLLVTAEELNLRKIFSLDSDFLFYKLKDGSTLSVVP